MSIQWEKGRCVYCGLPIVRHGELVPVYLHAACAVALRAVPEMEREALVARKQRERRQAEKCKQAMEPAEKAGAPMLPFQRGREWRDTAR